MAKKKKKAAKRKSSKKKAAKKRKTTNPEIPSAKRDSSEEVTTPGMPSLTILPKENGVPVVPMPEVDAARVAGITVGSKWKHRNARRVVEVTEVLEKSVLAKLRDGVPRRRLGYTVTFTKEDLLAHWERQ